MSYLSPASGPLRIVCFLVTSLLNSWKTQVLQLAFLGNTGLSLKIKNYSISEFHQNTTDLERKFEYTEP